MSNTLDTITRKNPMPTPLFTPKAAATIVIFVCGGAADVGELTDRAARQLHRDRQATMSCLAGIGAHDEDMQERALFAGKILLIDGCPKACARRTFEHAGLKRFLHFDLSVLGLYKGKSPATTDNIARVVSHALQTCQ